MGILRARSLDDESDLFGHADVAGLIVPAATPPSIALSARLALKWNVGDQGSGESRHDERERLGVSSIRTATRTISKAREASAAICEVVAATRASCERHSNGTTNVRRRSIADAAAWIWSVLRHHGSLARGFGRAQPQRR